MKGQMLISEVTEASEAQRILSGQEFTEDKYFLDYIFKLESVDGMFEQTYEDSGVECFEIMIAGNRMSFKYNRKLYNEIKSYLELR